MIRSLRLILATVISLFCLAARADEYTGIWVGDGLTILVYDCHGTYTGQIDQAGRVLPFSKAKVVDDTIKGQFQFGDKAFDFSIAIEGEAGTFTSGKTTKPVKRKTWDPFSFVGELIDKKDYAAAWAQLNPLIAQNQAHAFYVGALMHEHGWGCEPDQSQANKFYEHAAAAGSVSAMANLGVSYRDGMGVAKDPNKAFDLFKKAALLGDSIAAQNAGASLLNGGGIPVDRVEGIAWLMLSSEPTAAKDAERLSGKLTADERKQVEARLADLKAQRERQKAAKAFAEKPGTIPMALEVIDGKAVVKSVVAGSKAAEVGIKPGDVLVEVDKKATAGLRLEQIQALLNGVEGSNISMAFKRGEENMQIAMPREAVK